MPCARTKASRSGICATCSAASGLRLRPRHRVLTNRPSNHSVEATGDRVKGTHSCAVRYAQNAQFGKHDSQPLQLLSHGVAADVGKSFHPSMSRTAVVVLAINPPWQCNYLYLGHGEGGLGKCERLYGSSQRY